jgi:methylated-DNA-[protein]-cysteine S-methyltransferase
MTHGVMRLSFATRFGALTLSEGDGVIVALDWGAQANSHRTALLARAQEQLEAYFAGTRRRFDLPLDPGGTAFQRRVWHAMRAIPYGQTRSYGDLALELGTAARAIGGACAKNPIPIVIPCHRVLGAHRALGGYSGGDGLATKRRLLVLERARLPATTAT